MKNDKIIDQIIAEYPNSGSNEIEQAYEYNQVYDMMTDLVEKVIQETLNYNWDVADAEDKKSWIEEIKNKFI